MTVEAVASSANLGPGFDSVGLALGLSNDVTAEVCGDGLQVDIGGEAAADLPRDETHLVVRAAMAAFDLLGGRPAGMRLECLDRVPHARGLGSSAAAITAGVVLARALVRGGDEVLDDRTALRLAADLEGHPDNVAAALLGGLTLAWSDDDGARAVRLEPRVGAVALVPPAAVTTSAARDLLPAEVPHVDAAFTAGRAGLLVAALTGRVDLLLPATDERLHQRQRAAAMPETLRVMDELRAAGHAAVVSGAGPTVLVLHPEGETPELSGMAPTGWRTLPLRVSSTGTRLRD